MLFLPSQPSLNASRQLLFWSSRHARLNCHKRTSSITLGGAVGSMRLQGCPHSEAEAGLITVTSSARQGSCLMTVALNGAANSSNKGA
jgi:hypothetical protein